MIPAARQKAQRIHHAQVHAVKTETICADELWSFGERNRRVFCGEGVLRKETSTMPKQ